MFERKKENVFHSLRTILFYYYFYFILLLLLLVFFFFVKLKKFALNPILSQWFIFSLFTCRRWLGQSHVPLQRQERQRNINSGRQIFLIISEKGIQTALQKANRTLR